jgi:hypothetical protein
VKAERLAQLLHDLTPTTGRDLHRGLDDASPCPHPHRQQLIHRIDLDGHDATPLLDGPVEASPLACGADDQSETDDGRHLAGGHADHGGNGTRACTRPEHAEKLTDAVCGSRVLRFLEEAGLAESTKKRIAGETVHQVPDTLGDG